MAVADPPVDPRVKAWRGARPEVRMRARWELLARPEQLTPPGAWSVWLFLAGRGTGKTRTAAEDMACWALTHPNTRLAVVAPTFSDGRDTCVEGESGLLSVLPPGCVRLWNRSLGELFLMNGSRFKVYSSEKPRQLRGPQHHRAWCDELAHFEDFETWDMLLMGLRLGANPQVVATTTPRPVKLVRELMKRSDVVVSRGSTYDNAANLSPAALEQYRRRYEGTRLGRQELHGELIEEVEGALWRFDWIDQARRHAKPYLWQKRRVALDPADGTEDGAEHGLAVVGQGGDWQLYVLESDGYRCTPREFCFKAIEASERHGRATVVMEKNHGGAWLPATFEAAMREMGRTVPYQVITASRSKYERAEPVAMLYEQRKVSHLGVFPELEEQMTSFTGAKNEPSPDRLDALVHGLTELMGGNIHGAVDPETQTAVPWRDKPTPMGAVPWS